MEEIKNENQLENTVKGEENKNEREKRSVFNTLKNKGIDCVKNLKERASSFIQERKDKKEENEYIQDAFESKSKKFEINYKDGKKKNIFCLIDEDEKTLKLREKIDVDKVSSFRDEIKQYYYIDHISLNPFSFEVEFNEKLLKLDLQVVYYKNQKEMPQEIHIDKSIRIENSKVSGAVGEGAKNKKETKLGIDFNIFKKG